MDEFEKWYREYTIRVESGVDYLDTQLGWKECLKHVIYKLKTDANGVFELIKELESFS